mmetsp:Transcript_14617/g.21554  ORF Transcript_14617/g.21554 Transcript_14617/m.21554 type:complete len:357 (-) Transcript_14617:1026-2096(-)
MMKRKRAMMSSFAIFLILIVTFIGLITRDGILRRRMNPLGYRKLLLDPKTVIYKETEGSVQGERIKSGVLCGKQQGIDYLYEVPEKVAIKGILFLAHGCGHSMEDWWPLSEDNCPKCIGLPEERAIVKIALDHQLIAIATSSLGGCWSNSDAPRVTNVLRKFESEYGNIPIYAFGASSGGQFVASVLPSAMKTAKSILAGYISQIMSTYPPESNDVPGVYITMDRDKLSQSTADKIIESIFQPNHIPAKHIRLSPLPINNLFFYDRIVDPTLFTKEISSEMVKALVEAGMLDESSLLKEDPRQSNWRSILRPIVPEADSLTADASAVSEVLNAAWAMHEMSRDGMEDALALLVKKN